jgi:hypothetical protein
MALNRIERGNSGEIRYNTCEQAQKRLIITIFVFSLAVFAYSLEKSMNSQTSSQDRRSYSNISVNASISMILATLGFRARYG